MESLKLLAVGDHGVGRRTLLRAFVKIKENKDEVYEFESYKLNAVVEDKPYQVTLCHTALVQYRRLQPLNYPLTNVFLVCFSVVSPPSFQNLTEWVKQITHHCPNTAFLIVGTKSDLRESVKTNENLNKNVEGAISHEDATELARKLKAVKYVECSSLTQDGVNIVFDEAMLAAIQPTETKCCEKCSLV